MMRVQMLGVWLLCLLAALAALAWMAACVVVGRRAGRRFFSIAVGLDQTGNAVLGGSPDETVSSRAGRRWPRVARLINWLFRNPQHCANAIKSDRESAAHLLELD